MANKSGAADNFLFELQSGSLPDGLSLNALGKITGTPTKYGKYTVKYSVKNNGISLFSLDVSDQEDVTLTLNFNVSLKGEGTAESPYEIWDLDDLTYFRDSVNGGESYKDAYVKLAADINMSDTYGAGKKSWNPIGIAVADSTQTVGYKKYAFQGTFDGNGKKISGLYIQNTGSTSPWDKLYKGLFGIVENAVLKNLTVSGTITADKMSSVGGICAFAKNSTIEKCINECDIAAKVNGGGIVGFTSETVLVKECVNDGDVTVNNSNAGGIVGYASTQTTVSNCANHGVISVSGTTGDSAGGIVGYASVDGENTARIENCYSTGTASASKFAGGIVGYDNSDNVENCYYVNTGSATYTNSNGTSKSDISFTNGEVTHLLQNGQSELTWGQSLINSAPDGAVPTTDEAPILTSDPKKKVYALRFLANNEGEGDYAVYNNNVEYVNTGSEITTLPTHTSPDFVGWSEAPGGREVLLPYVFIKTEDTSLYSLWKGKVTFRVTNQKQTYLADTARKVTVTPLVNGAESNKLTAADFTVKYYEVNENTGELRSTTAVNAISAGKYLYVIDFANDDLKREYHINSAYVVTSVAGPPIDDFDNIGFMYITSGAENAQKPIFFAEGTVNLKVGGEYTNTLTNENGTTATYSSSNTNVATIDANGKVTAIGKGTATITATSVRENSTPVYASYTVNVTKEVITVTANNNTIKYGTDFANVTDNTYTVSKEGVTLSGTPVYTTDYEVGDGVGRYEIEVSGLTSDIYDIEYKSGKLKVEAKPLTADDFEVTVKDKDYDGSKKAEVTAKVKDTSLVSGDVVTVLAGAEFESADSDYRKQQTVTYEITGLSGRDSANYCLSGNITGTKTAVIYRAKVSISAPTYTSYVYDGEPKSVSIKATVGGEVFDGVAVTYWVNTTKYESPTDVNTYTLGFRFKDDEMIKNYELSDVTNDPKLEIKSAKQDVFSIEGISDTVNYGDDKENAITLQTAGAIEGGSVTYEIVSGGDCAEINNNTVTIKKVGTIKIKATSTKKNYTDKTATKTVVIKPKTLTVTAEANTRAYDGTKDVDVLLSLNGVLSGDSVKINGIGKNSDGKYEKTATVATADVENAKTVFVNGLGIDNDNYVLAQTSVQTTVNITKKPITEIEFTAAHKTYDGSDDVLSYTIGNLESVIDADKNFVTVTGTAKFDSKNVKDVTKATLSDLVLSGTKSGNYTLTRTIGINNSLTIASVDDQSAKINKATVNFEFGTLSYVYDGKAKTVPITATVGGKAFDGYTVTYGGEAKQTNAKKYDIEITLDDNDNYQSDYTSTKQLEIVKADQGTIMITGLPGTIDYDKEFTLAAIGGSSELAPKWSTSNENIATVDENTGAVKIVKADGVTPVTITVTKSDNDSNHTTQSASVTFTPVKKTATFRITGLTHTYDGNPKAAIIATNATYDIKYTKEDGTELTSGTTPTDAGTYYVEVTAKGNYEGEQIAVMTIRKGTLDTKNITISIPENLVYGDSYSVTTNYNGGTITYSGTGINGKPTTQPTNAGSYTATLTINDPNYEIVTVEKPFEIAKRKLNVKIKGENGTETVKRAYGEANPVFELDYSGFANNETKAVLLIEPTANTTANSSSNVGNYPIAIIGGYDENYYFDISADGVLEVTAATTGNFRVVASGSADAYVGNKFTLGAYYNNEIQTDVKWTSSKPDIVTVDDKGNVEIKGMSETVTITATAGETSNCKGMTATYTITPQKKHISLSASATELVKVYNGEEQYINFTAPSGVDLTNVTVNTAYVMTTNPSKDKPIDVGTYMVSYEIDDDCYEGSGNFTLTINKATVTVSADAIEKEYGADPVYKLNVSNNVKGIDAETMTEFVTITSDGAAKTAVVGDYDINVALTKTSDENCNYVVNTEANGNLKVTPATLTVNVADITREYGAANPTELTYTIDGFKNGETADILTGSITPVYAETIKEEVGTQKDVVTALSTLANGNYTVEVKYAEGEGADLTITKIAVKASVGTSRAKYLTVNFDKAVESDKLSFTVKQGDTPVEIASVTPSSDGKTYSLNGTFTVGTAYTVEIAYTSEMHEITEGQTLTITPAKESSGGGGGGGGGSSTSTSYTVKFETNGGSKVDSVKVEKNKTVAEPTAPTKDGFEFDGWYSDKKLTIAYDFDTKVTKAITLYAKWTEKKVDDNKDDSKDDDNKPSTNEWKNPFTDVTKADWFFDNVRYASQNGLMSGTADTEFAPNDNLTRGMLVTVLYRAEGEPAVNKSIPFGDVNASQYYANAVIWAEQNGIVKGVSETEFAPDENITREQIATIIYRYAEYKGIAPTGAWAIKLDYADVADISDYAVEGVMYCTMKNIMQGKDNNMFAPKDNATRAEIAAILGRFIEGNK